MKQPFPFILYSFLFVLFSFSLNGQNVKVFILAGQSNMQGHGDINPVTVNGTLAHFIENDALGTFDFVQNSNGSWTTRDDVWVRYDHENAGLLTDILGVGFGGYEGQIGPELGFGHLLGDYSQDQILIIKTCWGGKSLAVDFRPPSSGGAVGAYYTQMISDINTSINNISQEFPEYTGGQIEIAGFCWFQGWNDGEEDTYLYEYEENMKNLIVDVRADLNLTELPVVIGLTGNGGVDLLPGDLWVQGLQTVIVPAQINAAEFTDFSNVAYADTRDFWREENQSPEPDAIHHWRNNAESYLRIGNELGIKMIELLDQLSSSTDIASEPVSVSLFPSPANHQFQLKGIQDNINLNILNLNGQIVKSLENISELDMIDISTLTEGFYFIEILNQENIRTSIHELIKKGQ